MQPGEEVRLVEKKSTFWDYFRFGESYTSLILGIIVVVIATAMLLSFVHNKNAGNTNTPINQQAQNTVQLSQQAQSLAQQAPVTPNDGSVTTVPTETVAPTAIPTPTAQPTVKPQPKVTPKPQVKHVEIAIAKPSSIKQPVRKIVAIKHKASKKIVQNNYANKNVWVVQKGESLWIIAVKKYTNGYNWVDIARVNNLSNPSDIHVGDKLILPAVTPKTSTIATNNTSNTGSSNKNNRAKANNSNVQENYTSSGVAITGNSYTVVHGDNLWNVAVRAYGNGFKWVDIARANNLANPRMIFSGNVLIIPRT